MIFFSRAVRRTVVTVGAALSISLMLGSSAHAQLFTFPKQDLIDYTAKSSFDRLPDGRPKVPDALIERARDLSSEEVWATLHEKGFNNQYADGFQVLHPGKTMVGRVHRAVHAAPRRRGGCRGG